MFIALCQASHTAIYTLLILLLINKPVLAPLTGVTPDKVSVQHKPRAAAKQKQLLKGTVLLAKWIITTQANPSM